MATLGFGYISLVLSPIDMLDHSHPHDMQGFDLNRLLKSYNNFIYARQVATRLFEYFFSLQVETEKLSLPQKHVAKDEVSGTQRLTGKGTAWPLPLITELKEAKEAMRFDTTSTVANGRCPEGGPTYRFSSPDGSGPEDRIGGVEALSAFIRAIQRGGLLLGVAGPVGSGKTTLLHELMWQLWLSKGETIAFTAQKAWIARGSLSSRISFGSGDDRRSEAAGMEMPWLQKVVDACGLRSDIEGGTVGVTGPILTLLATTHLCILMQASPKALTRTLVKVAACYLVDNVHECLWPDPFMQRPK